jgi:hypothetical protein
VPHASNNRICEDTVLRGALTGSSRTAVLIALALLLLPASACRRGPAAPEELPISSSFLQNAEGWTAVGDGDLFYAPAGGKPSNTGYIFIIDRVQGDTYYFHAPAKFRGNLAQAYGRLLLFDLVWLETATGQFKDDDDVILSGAGLTITAALPQLPTNTWTSYAIPLDVSGGWVRQGTDQPATAAEIQAVLGSLQQLRIRGEFRSGPEQGGLDNVRLGALP